MNGYMRYIIYFSLPFACTWLLKEHQCVLACEGLYSELLYAVILTLCSTLLQPVILSCIITFIQLPFALGINAGIV